MQRDPVVEEVRRNGAMSAEECGDDVRRMAERLREAAARSGRRVVRRERPSARSTPPTRQGPS